MAYRRTRRRFGYSYTQLTDILQEQNAFYTYDRRVKFDMDHIRRLRLYSHFNSLRATNAES